jgi:hypothetical protein
VNVIVPDTENVYCHNPASKLVFGTPPPTPTAGAGSFYLIKRESEQIVGDGAAFSRISRL